MCWLLGQLIVEATRAERLCKSEPSWLNSGYIQWPKSNRPCVAGHHVPSRSIDWCFMDWMGPVFQTVGIFKLGAWDLWHVPLTWTTQPAACKCPFSQCQIELACRSVSHCDSAIRAIHMSRKQNQTRQNKNPTTANLIIVYFKSIYKEPIYIERIPIFCWPFPLPLTIIWYIDSIVTWLKYGYHTRRNWREGKRKSRK